MKAFAILSMLVAAQAAPSGIDGTGLAPLPRQALPARGCAAYLWSASGERTLVAMVTADPGQLRLSLGGTLADLPRTGQQGEAGFGFYDNAVYGAGDVVATLDMTVTARGDLKDGAAVPSGTLRLDRAGQDGVVLPITGLIGCV